MSASTRRPRDETAQVSRASEIHKINLVAAALLRQRGLDDLLWTLAEQIGSILGLEDCVIYLRDGERLLQVAAYGPKNPVTRQIANPITIEIGNGITGLVARTGVSMLIRDTTEDPLYVADLVGGGSELAVPLVDAGEVLGVIDTESPEVDAYREADRAFLQQIADLASPRIAAAREDAERHRALEGRIRDLETEVERLAG